MNLYKEVFTHYSQKDYKDGIERYFLAKNDEEAYNMVFPYDSELVDWENLEMSKEEIIRCHGDLYHDKMENLITDLYYGATIKGWDLVKQNISKDEIKLLKELNIVKECE